ARRITTEEKVRTLLDQLVTDTDEAIDTLRDLARGIYPPLLAAEGLPAALRAQARKAAVPVSVEAAGQGRRYGQDQEAAVYFCCLEALQNVAKYAGATSATIRLEASPDGSLSFEVRDDGAGFDPEKTPMGSGLTNMTDRIEALGGSLTVTAAPGQGTTVRGSLPVEVGSPTGAELPTADDRSAAEGRFWRWGLQR
ncbi:MAG TPA: ATP-binding protein, partial [Cryptosporangiaceae bacterium]|nr:ATP-binding protein [Cryptosporangiaceae bacterium]